MSDAPENYRPFAKGYGILIGIILLWAGSLGVFLAGKSLYLMWNGEGGE